LILKISEVMVSLLSFFIGLATYQELIILMAAFFIL